MNPDPTPPPGMPGAPDPLDRLLDRWSEPAPTGGSALRHEVWRRIEHGEDESCSDAGWVAIVESWFSRPSFAAAFVLSCVLLGLFFAELRVSSLREERGARLAQNYLQLIDPLMQPGGDGGAQ